MKATAKYLFDEDFAAGEKPTITMVEHERRRADAEFAGLSARLYRRARAGTSGSHPAHGRRALRDRGRARPARRRAYRNRDPSRNGGRRGGGRGRRQASRRRSSRASLSPKSRRLRPNAFTIWCPRRLSPCALRQTSTRRRRRRSRKSHEHDGFDGRLAIISDESLAPGDCRVEWADGGIIRDTTATASVIDETVARYIAARNMPAA